MQEVMVTTEVVRRASSSQIIATNKPTFLSPNQQHQSTEGRIVTSTRRYIGTKVKRSTKQIYGTPTLSNTEGRNQRHNNDITIINDASINL